MTSRRRSLRWLPRALRSAVCTRFGVAPASALIIGSALAFGCGSNDGGSDSDEPLPPGGQTGGESFGCQPVERDMLAWSERSALGLSAAELLNALGSTTTERLIWSGGSGTPLTLAIERDAGGSVELQRREYVSGSGAEPAAEIAFQCNDVVAIPVMLSFATADGAFAEQWPLTLLAESTTRVTANLQVDVADLEGSFSVTEVDPSGFDRVLASVQLGFENGAWTGTLSGQGITAGSNDPDSATSATHFDIAAF